MVYFNSILTFLMQVVCVWSALHLSLVSLFAVIDHAKPGLVTAPSNKFIADSLKIYYLRGVLFFFELKVFLVQNKFWASLFRSSYIGLLGGLSATGMTAMGLSEFKWVPLILAWSAIAVSMFTERGPKPEEDQEAKKTQDKEL